MDHLAKSPESSWETLDCEGKAIRNGSVLVWQRYLQLSAVDLLYPLAF
jgi:hypothetical protein